MATVVKRFPKLYEVMRKSVGKMVSNDVEPEVWNTLTGEPLFRNWCKDANDANSSTQKQSRAKVQYATAGAVMYSLPHMGDNQSGRMYQNTYQSRKKLLEHVNDWCVDQTWVMAIVTVDPDVSSKQWDQWARSGYLTNDRRWRFTTRIDWRFMAKSWSRLYPDEPATPEQLRERYKTARESFGQQSRYMISQEKVQGLMHWLVEIPRQMSDVRSLVAGALSDSHDLDWSLLTPKARKDLLQLAQHAFDLESKTWHPAAVVSAFAAWRPYLLQSAGEEKMNEVSEAVSNLVRSHSDYLEALEVHAQWLEVHEGLQQLLDGEPVDREPSSDDTTLSQSLPAWSPYADLLPAPRRPNRDAVDAFIRRARGGRPA